MTVLPRTSSLALEILLAIFGLTGLPGVGVELSPTAIDRKSIARGSSSPGAMQGIGHPPAGLPEQQQNQSLLVTVVDENSVPVSFAQLTLAQAEGQAASKGETDYAGRYKFSDLSPSVYRLRVEKEGFYALNLNEVRVGETEGVEATLNHQQEFVEVMDVASSPPAIDPAKTTSSQNLHTREIVDLPYAVPRDIRYALPLLPGVLQDVHGQVHVDGSSTRQILDQLDGFNITNPVTGSFDVRVGVDAVRSLDVQTSRYSAEYGKASGGILSLTSGMGDDRYRFSGTDFLPTFQSRKGIHVKTWTPHGAFSGPLRKGKAWFLLAPDGEYDLNIVDELPPGADQNSVWRVGNLAKAQVNLTPANILTSSLLVNEFRDQHAGISRFDPLETTRNLNEAAYLLTVRDQSLRSNGMLMEYGIGVSRFRTDEHPLGNQPYIILPEGTSGNFFETAEGRAGRLQGVANFVLPPLQEWGRHEFKVGADLDRVTYDQSFERGPILILREDRSLSRRTTFPGSPSFRKNNSEVSGYAQDHWSLSDRLLVDSGLRFEWDQIVRHARVSPRLAASYLATRSGNTKIVSGIGLYYDASSLELITRPLDGQRIDLFYDKAGQTLIRPPVETSFQADARSLKEPRFLTWSVGLEQKLPTSIYLRIEFVQKRGRDGWTYVNSCAAPLGCLSELFALRNDRRDRVDSVEVTMRRIFKQGHVFLVSYTRSAARSNAILNFNITNPLFSPQEGGPLPWDTPNRFISWGLLPLWRRFDLAYTLDWRDGFPFSLVNQDQQLVGPPSSRRFPTYFSLNMALEKRIHALGFQWDMRLGLGDITNRHNPSGVNNNVDSPQFLTFGGLQGRTLTGQIRLLGRK